jgi:peptide deformylase
MSMKYVEKPSNVPAREVTEADIPRVIDDAVHMRKLCWKPIGRHRQAHAIAHPQVCEKPLQFFVTRMGETIINPRIKERHGELVKSSEGCMSFPRSENARIPRHECVIVRYFTPFKDASGKWTLRLNEKGFVGLNALVFQHEIDHLRGVTIYDYDTERIKKYESQFGNTHYEND